MILLISCAVCKCCPFILSAAHRMLYICLESIIATILHHSLLLLANLHYANCFYFTWLYLINDLYVVLFGLTLSYVTGFVKRGLIRAIINI